MEKIVTVETEDVFEILEQVPQLNSILDFPGTYLAGGAIRTLFSPTEEFLPDKTDIDLFFESPSVLEKVKKQLDGEYIKVFQCPQGLLATFVHPETQWKVQCVSMAYYFSLSDLLRSFDFTVTMFGTDGTGTMMGENSLEHLINRELVWNVITYPASSMRRMMKYARKGYHMREEELQKFTDAVWNHAWTISDESLVYID